MLVVDKTYSNAACLYSSEHLVGSFFACSVCGVGLSTWYKTTFLLDNKVVFKLGLNERSGTSFGQSCTCTATEQLLVWGLYHNVLFGRTRTGSLVTLNSMYACTNQQHLRHVCVWFSLGWLAVRRLYVVSTVVMLKHSVSEVHIYLSASRLFLLAHIQNKHTCTHRHLHRDCFYLCRHWGIGWLSSWIRIEYLGFFCGGSLNCTMLTILIHRLC